MSSSPLTRVPNSEIIPKPDVNNINKALTWKRLDINASRKTIDVYPYAFELLTDLSSLLLTEPIQKENTQYGPLKPVL